ncbi:MAG: CDP-alcohol phosphatidyltransferase family protein [Sphingosinicella sp.]|uniref:CDP-alcohol phosphatidyltransferase family protein n=1 Tax=Sphingosinicella sp. TaxID=1917971 RepID=UPI0040378DFE
MGSDGDFANRRPLKSRGTGWAGAATRALLATRITANQVSVAGVLISLLGAWAFVEAPGYPWLYLAGALAIQLRLLCNMLDGLVAVEGGRKSAYGPLYNEVPDRIEDSVFLIAFGFAAGLLWLGLAAALLAAVTAYVRALGGTFGFPQDFRGPMAKPHRMATLTLGAIAALIEALWQGTHWALAITLWLIMVGSALTIVLRVLGIARRLKAAA